MACSVSAAAHLAGCLDVSWPCSQGFHLDAPAGYKAMDARKALKVLVTP
jgi:hypothetical protein